MVQKLKIACGVKSCPGLAETGHRFCPAHQDREFDKQKLREHDKDRPSSSSRGYDARWRRARLLFLARHPLCAECEREGRISAATLVDHIRAHKGDYDLFWDDSNWQSLCTAHHQAKTIKELASWNQTGQRSAQIVAETSPIPLEEEKTESTALTRSVEYPENSQEDRQDLVDTQNVRPQDATTRSQEFPTSSVKSATTESDDMELQIKESQPTGILLEQGT